MICKVCGDEKLPVDMVRNQKSKSGFAGLCKKCKSIENKAMHARAKVRKSGNYKVNYHAASCNDRDEHEMERPDKTVILEGYLNALIEVYGTDLTYVQLGLDFPDCTKNGVTQPNAIRELAMVLNHELTQKPIALDIDQAPIDAWKGKDIQVYKEDWANVDRVVANADFIYSNDFGNAKGMTALPACKKLQPKIMSKLIALRNGKLTETMDYLKKEFNNYKMYSYNLSAVNRGNMRMVVLVRNDVVIELPTLAHRRYEE